VLSATFKEAGLGNNQNIDYTLTADVNATFGFVNNGGNVVQGQIADVKATFGFKPLPAPKVLIDPVELARNKLRMSFNSLAQIASLLGCNSKTEVDPSTWTRAAFDGDKGAMDYIVEHCLADVVRLEAVVDKLKELSTGFNPRGSGR